MAQSLAGFASILKEFYLGPIQDQLNEETLVCELMEKASVDWNGRQVIIPVHTGRNTAVGWRAEGAWTLRWQRKSTDTEVATKDIDTEVATKP